MTTEELAKLIGVSRVTLSKVLNGKGGVAPATVEKIQKYVETYHFEPNSQARGLVGKKDKIIGFFTAFNSETDANGHIPIHFPSEMTNLIIAEAQKYGYKTLVSITKSSDDFDSIVKFLNSGLVLGAILLGFETGSKANEEWSVQGHPLLLINQEETMEGKNVSLVNMDDEEWAFKAVEMLVQKGHRRILYLGSSLSRLPAQRRSRGAKRAFELYEKDIDRLWWRDADFEEDLAYQVTKCIFEGNGVHPTGIFAANDVMAIGAMTALKDLGYQIPNQVSVIGFDDIAISRYLSPALTTINSNFMDIARRSVRILIDNIEGKRSACHEEAELTFVERETLAEALKG